MTTAVVIDPALAGPGNPHHTAALGWIGATRAAGRDVRVLGRRDGTQLSIDAVPIEPAFSAAPDNFATDDPRATQRQLRAARCATRDALERLLANVGPGDVLILLHADLPVIDGVTAWAAGIESENLPRLVVWTTRAPRDDPFTRSLGTAEPLVASFDRLRALFGNRAALLASSDDQAARYRELNCGAFGVLPAAALGEDYAAPAPFLTDQAATVAPTSAAEPTLPGVDIIVTLHNYARFLEGCLASVARQSYPHWRCIVVDDGSTDVAFDTLRAQIASFGPRFGLAHHAHAEGQGQALATGLSLGSNPFVVMLDADDRLEPEALDLHIAWHLNSTVPVALTSGQMRVVEARGRMMSRALDNIVALRFIDRLRELPTRAAFRRPGAGLEPPPARFADRDEWSGGDWYWAASSGLMFRRSIMELIAPDAIPFGADTYYGFGAHAFGSSILIDAIVARYTRHGGNAYANATIYGAATLPVRATVSGGWVGAASILRRHIECNRARFDDEMRAEIVDSVLELTRATPDPAARSQQLAPPPLVPRVIRRLRHEAQRLRALARRMGVF